MGRAVHGHGLARAKAKAKAKEEAMSRERATELEYLKWFRHRADFGPADGDVKAILNKAFMDETGQNLPEGWNIDEDGETCLDREKGEGE